MNKFLRLLLSSAIILPTASSFGQAAPSAPAPAAAQFTTGAGYGAQTAWNNPSQNMGDGQTRPGYSKLNWAADYIMPLSLREGIMTLINFPEEIIDSYMGDKDFFDGKPLTTTSFGLAPVEGRAPADTNLIVYGKSGRKYAFYLRSETINTPKITNVIVDVIVPGLSSATTSVGGTKSSSSSSSAIKPTGANAWGGNGDLTVDPTKLIWDLDILVPNPSDLDIAPERAWRDGQFIYLDFGAKAKAMLAHPVASIIIEGLESPITPTVTGEDNRLSVFKSGGQGDVSIILRSGQKVVCIKQINGKPSLVDNDDVEYMRRLLRAENQNTGIGANYGYNQQGGMVTSSQNYTINTTGAAGATYANYDKLSTDFYSENNGGKISRGSILPKGNVPLIKVDKNRIALEVAVDESVEKLEEYWNKLYNDNKDGNLGQIFEMLSPFYSVESKGVDELGARSYHGAELYRLRLMLKNGSDFTVEDADSYCRRLGIAGITCNVVKEQ